MSSDIDLAIDAQAADAIVAAYVARGGQPAIGYGIVAGGALVHVAGFGSRVLSGAAPDRDTVFRIASMTKSFTAAAILLLRDSGLLALDEVASDYVPELASWAPVTPDAGPVTVRNLLTMTAGFPTDDPWGDRQQGLSPAAFGSLLAGGVSWNWAPGTRFEYSNLGYAILGRVVTAVSGVEYAQFVRDRLLAPLGMTRTGYTAEEFGGQSAPMDCPAAAPPGSGANLAQGYRRGPDSWAPVPYEPYGAFAPMGGVFSTVRDLAVWVDGFASAFPPGGSGAAVSGAAVSGGSVSGCSGGAVGVAGSGALGAGAHPLSAASRREMQLPQAVTAWRAPERLPGGGSAPSAYYGFGLFVDEDPALGRVVNHSGGYPGFGTSMRWHPATGVGVIALANGTYAGMSALGARILRAIVPGSAARHVALAPVVSAKPEVAVSPKPEVAVSAKPAVAVSAETAPVVSAEPAPGAAVAPGRPAGGPWAATLAARDAVDELLRSWDDAAADALFTENVALDGPYPERRHAIGLIRSRIGEFRPDERRPAESDTPAHRRWWLTGKRGTVQAQIQLSPERQPRVQSLTLAVPPAPGDALDVALSAVVTWMNSGERKWPESVRVAAGTDVTLLARRLRMAAAWAGDCRPGAFRAGDGSASASVELDGEHATVVLTLVVNPDTGELRQADLDRT